ncbi:MAG TPA: twin-arginine translocation signal domain-containing protein [Stellaceae bacterium]
MPSFDRRHFLQGSVALGGTMLASGVPLHRSAEAAVAHINAPVVDRVVLQVATDGAHDIFLRGAEVPGLSVQP